MNFAWRTKNRLLWAAGLSCGALIVSMSPTALNWLASSRVSDAEEGQHVLSADKTLRIERPRSTGEKISPEDLLAASSIKLQRMNPPTPPAPSPKPPVTETKPTAPAVLFSGSLVGTIQDSDPNYCFAFLKKQDNTVILIRKGDKLEDSASSPVVDSISTQEVKLVRGPESQILKVVE